MQEGVGVGVCVYVTPVLDRWPRSASTVNTTRSDFLCLRKALRAAPTTSKWRKWFWHSSVQ